MSATTLHYGTPTPGSRVVERAEGPDGNAWYEKLRGTLLCTVCGERPSNPDFDGEASDEDGPAHFCNQCAEQEGVKKCYYYSILRDRQPHSTHYTSETDHEKVIAEWKEQRKFSNPGWQDDGASYTVEGYYV